MKAMNINTRSFRPKKNLPENRTKTHYISAAMKRVSLLICLMLLGSLSLQAQGNDPGPFSISGPASVDVGDTETYTLSSSNGTGVSLITWFVNSMGTKMSETQNSVTIQWNTAGTGEIQAQITDNTIRGNQYVVDAPNVTVNNALPPPTPPATPGSPIVLGFSCGEVELVATGNPPPFVLWYWQGTSPNGTLKAQTSASIYTVTSSGTYYLRAYHTRDGLWSIGSSSMVITVPDTPGDVTVTGISSRCKGGGVSNFNATASNNTGFTWTISPSAAGTIDSNGGVSWSSIFSGVATIKAETGNSFCGIVEDTKTVTVHAPVGDVTMSGGVSTRCQGTGTTNFNASASGATSYTWSISPPGAGSISSSGLVTWLDTFSGTASIIVAATGVGGCRSTTDTKTIVVTPAIGPTTITGGVSTRCQAGGTTDYNVLASNATGFNWSISPPAAGSINSAGLVTWNSSFNGQATISVEATNSCFAKNASKTVTVNPEIGVTTISGGVSARCQGTGTTDFNASANNATNFSWSISPPNAGLINSSGVVNWADTFSGTATIIVTSSAASGCNTTTKSKTVDIIPLVGPVTITGPDEVCAEVVSYFSASAENSNSSFAWSIEPAEAGEIDIMGKVIWEDSFSGTAIIEATAIGIQVGGTNCGSSTSTKIVTVDSEIGTLSITGFSAVRCRGEETTNFEVNAPAGSSLLWEISSSEVGIIDATTGVLEWDEEYAGIATITVTATNSCGSSTASVQVQSDHHLTQVEIEGIDERCSEPGVTQFTASSINATGYSWQINPEAGTIDATNGLVTWNSGFSGTAIITVTASNACGSNSATHTVIVHPIEQGVSVTDGVFARWEGVGTTDFNSSSTSGTDTWSFSPEPAAGSINTSTGVVSWDSDFTGFATVSVESAGYCAIHQASRQVEVVALPVIQSSGGNETCGLGNEITLSLNRAYDSYEWKRDGIVVGTGSTIEPNIAGNYTVTVTSAASGARTSEAIDITASSNLTFGDYNYVVSTSLLVDLITSEAAINDLTVDERTVNVQYTDGLGRPWQNVAVEASPQKGHIVQPFVYDQLGRQTKQYLPYVTDDCSVFQINPVGINEADYVNSPQYQFYQTAEKVAHDVAPFSQAILEYSPLTRVLKQGAPGATWQPVEGSITDHVVRSDYGTNTMDDEVLSFEMVGNTASFSGVNGQYEPGMLSKLSTRDEDQNEVLEFTDKSGRVVLKRVATGIIETPWADTYYVYDDFGNLRIVLPPEASQALEVADDDLLLPEGYTLVTEDLVVTNANYTGGSYMYFRGTKITLSPDLILNPGAKVISYQFSEAFLDRWAFQYKYDKRNRMTDKKVPGSGWVFLLYDLLDRLIGIQDAVQQSNIETTSVTFNKYDALGRKILTGTVLDALVFDSGLENQAALDGWLPSFAIYEALSTDGDNILGYTRSAIPRDNNVDFYETATYYDDYGILPPDFSFTYVQELGNGPYNTKVKGQVVASQTKLLDGSNIWLKIVNYYDDRYRVIQTQSENQLGGIDRVTFKYDFAGRVLETKTTHDDGTPADDIIVAENFTYDHASRLMQATHQVGNDPEIVLVKNEYNELGELIDKKLHSADAGINFEQSVDYRYNIRGWLEHINDHKLSDGEGDYFGMRLYYNNSSSNPSYNGNISLMMWSLFTKDDNVENRAYNYSYDGMNRLTKADYIQKQGGTWTSPDKYDVDLKYDLNGNIELLERYHTNTSTPMDNLNYDYDGNQLIAVTDNGDVTEGFKDGNIGSPDYTYDANGNMISDANKNITAITYNRLNLPQTVTFTGNRTINYVYDAAGIKLAKITNDDGTIKTTDYVGGFIYEDGVLQQFAQAEGRVRRKDNGDFVYDYYLKDHLGNTRITFSADKPEVTYRATMETELFSQEDPYFINIENLREINIAANKTGSDTNANVIGNEVVRLNGSDAALSLGPGKMLEVTAGDKVDMEVYAYYEGTPGSNSPIDNAIFAALIGNAFGGSATGTEGQQALQSGFENNLASTVPSTGAGSNTDIKAYLNYISFNGDFDAVDAGFVRVDQGLVEGNHRLLQLNDIAIEQSGFLYVYVSNEGNVDFNVFFDELEITHTSGGILQEDHYYPFGMNIDALSSFTPLSKPNKNRYSGKEEQIEFNLNWYDFDARMYDQSLGRFNSMDLLADSAVSWTPYHYVRNNPLNRIDPTGLTDYELNAKGEVVNVIENEKADNIYIIDQDGARIDGQSISFEYGTITAVRNPEIKQRTKTGDLEEVTLTLFEVNGDENAKKMFEFLADPSSTNVEWTNASIGKAMSDKNVVGTSHKQSSTAVGHYLRIFKYTLKEVYHNHPSGVPRPSNGDRDAASLYYKVNKNILLAIYAHPGRYVLYNENGLIGNFTR